MVFLLLMSASDGWVIAAISHGLFCQTTGQLEYGVLGLGIQHGLPAVRSSEELTDIPLPSCGLSDPEPCMFLSGIVSGRSKSQLFIH